MLKKLFSQKWFYGFMEDDKAIAHLMQCPTKSYLVRESSIKGCFTLLFTIEDDKKEKQVERFRFQRNVDLIIEVEKFVKKQKLRQPPSSGIYLISLNK